MDHVCKYCTCMFLFGLVVSATTATACFVLYCLVLSIKKQIKPLSFLHTALLFLFIPKFSLIYIISPNRDMKTQLVTITITRLCNSQI